MSVTSWSKNRLMAFWIIGLSLEAVLVAAPFAVYLSTRSNHNVNVAMAREQVAEARADAASGRAQRQSAKARARASVALQPSTVARAGSIASIATSDVSVANDSARVSASTATAIVSTATDSRRVGGQSVELQSFGSSMPVMFSDNSVSGAGPIVFSLVVLLLILSVITVVYGTIPFVLFVVTKRWRRAATRANDTPMV